jgi:hypothetical protein
MGSIAAGDRPVSLSEEAWGLASGGLAAVAVVVKAEAGSSEGPIMQIAAVGGDVAAVALQGSPRCRGPVLPLSTAAATVPVVVPVVSTAAAAAVFSGHFVPHKTKLCAARKCLNCCHLR